MNQELFRILLGQKLECVDVFLRELGVKYTIELTEPTRCLSQLGPMRIVKASSCGLKCIQLTCVRESM